MISFSRILKLIFFFNEREKYEYKKLKICRPQNFSALVPGLVALKVEPALHIMFIFHGLSSIQLQQMASYVDSISNLKLVSLNQLRV